MIRNTTTVFNEGHTRRDAALAALAPNPTPTSASDDEETTYLVAYGKVVDDKEDGVYLQGVYFGGLAHSHDEAESLARECVNGVKGGVVLPRIVPMASRGQILEAMDRASRRLHQMETQMVQAEEILGRSANRTRARRARTD